jgi:hypothetical protein
MERQRVFASGLHDLPECPSARRQLPGWFDLMTLAVCTLALTGSVRVRAENQGDDAAVASLRLATFVADVSPPLGHPLFGSISPPAQEIGEPLTARGLVLLGSGAPIVIVSVDWLEIRNDAYQFWREALAQAAGTQPQRVLVSCVHQHDAPLADLTAQRLLTDQKLAGQWIDPAFHRRAVQGVADALRAALPKAQPVTHLGTGKALVEGVASNRRYLGSDGKPRHDRGSASTDPLMRFQPEGTIDAWLRTLSFWNGDQPLVALSAYATHPMSYYRTGRVSSDFPGIARERRQAETPDTPQIYFSGASGNVTAGKYNDGDPQNRSVLADRLYRAMGKAWAATKRVPIGEVQFRSVPFTLPPRDEPGFTIADLQARLAATQDARTQCLAALGLSWRQRVAAGVELDLPALDFGPAVLLLLPAESYVEYQLLAGRLRPRDFVFVAGYGECGPGYIPHEKAWTERDANLNDWCWVAPGAEALMTAAIREALSVGAEPESAEQAAAAEDEIPWRVNEPLIHVNKELAAAHPHPGTAALISMRYVGPRLERQEIRGVEFRDDVHSERTVRWSHDDGQTWSKPRPLPSTDVYYDGREVWEGSIAQEYDPRTNVLVDIWLRQIRQGDQFNCFSYARTSRDQGQTFSEPRQLRYEPGPDFDPQNVEAAEFLRANQAYPGSSIFRHSNGTLIHPVAHANAPHDAENDRRAWRLGSLCFIGRWNPERGDYEWQAGERVEVPPTVSSRGLMEPEAAALKDGRVLVVWRGSHTAETPGRKFFSLSQDGGLTLSPPAEWRYDDGTAFYSPSSLHRLIRHQQNGKLYWVGNICAAPPVGNSPRYPLVIAEVDEQRAAIRRDTVTAIDDRQPGQPAELQFSNFSLLENRKTHAFELWLTQYGERPDSVFSADAYHYTLTLRADEP